MRVTTNITHEIARKSIHLSSIWVPLSVFFIPLAMMQKVFLLLLALLVVFDFLRISTSQIGYSLRYLLKESRLDLIFRDHERTRFSGATFMMFSATAAASLFDKELFILAFMILVISDTFAAIIGKKFGKRPIMDKTFEGSLTFFFCSMFIVITFGVWIFRENEYFLASAMIAAAITTFVELYSKRINIDDNLSIPFAFGGIYLLLDNTIFNY